MNLVFNNSHPLLPFASSINVITRRAKDKVTNVLKANFNGRNDIFFCLVLRLYPTTVGLLCSGFV